MIVFCKQYRCPYPFTRGTVTKYAGSGEESFSYKEPSWIPGVEFIGNEAVCDGAGEMVCDVISIHKPGKYPERIFYVRRWKDPDGKEFGKNKLRITTMGAFKSMIRGYRYPVEERRQK